MKHNSHCTFEAVLDSWGTRSDENINSSSDKTISFRTLIFTTSKQCPIYFKFVCNIPVLISYQWPKNGFVVFSIEGVRDSQFLAVLSDTFRFNLVMPTNKIACFCNSAKPQKKVDKYLSRVEVCFKVNIQDISIGTQYFWFLNEGDTHKVEKMKLREATL